MLRIANQTPGKWRPKQCVKVNSSTFSELAGNGSEKIAKHITSLVAPFASGAVIHDNACGKGVVSKEVIAASLPESVITQDLVIHATDLSPAMVKDCQELAVEKGWTGPPIQMKSELMAMQDLTFPDETFSHSFTNFAIFALQDPEAAKAASHIYRTLQRGGKAFLTVWAESPTSETLQATHHATRSRTDSLPMFSRLYWKEHSHIRKVLLEAGFSEDSIDITQQEVYIDIKDLNQWSQVAWTLAGRPAEGWEEKDEERWEGATSMIREGIQKSKGFQTLEGGGCQIRCVVNVAVAKK
jgi:ubiquinone/menaquinone biosynthesis C-methylase UbiE